MTAAWHARVPIAVDVIEGPEAFDAIQHAKDQVRGCALLEGLDPDRIVFRVVAPARVQGVTISLQDCPMTGRPIPEPYQLTAIIQENES